MKQKMPIGIENFKQLRENNYYFVDKTDFIRQLIDEHANVTLITRPRRFGKTLTMSMLEWFFSVDKEVESRDLFTGLAVERAGQAYMSYRGQSPVLFLSLKNFTSRNWTDMLAEWRTYLKKLFLQHTNLRDASRVQIEQIEDFQQIVQRQADLATMADSLSLLLNMMHQYYGKPVILLIDEYDAPIERAWNENFYDDGIAFMRKFLGNALKTNPDLDFAILTGVLRIAKESIFSGLNNLDVYSVLSDKYSEVFGFTTREIERLTTDLSITEKLPEIKFWYDGYHISKHELYNPWSVINYVDKQCKPQPYWVRSSGNAILQVLLHHADILRVHMTQTLLEGKAVQVSIDEGVIYPEIKRNQSALFTMMLTTGYLTVQDVISELDERYALKIPNEEVRRLYRTEILNNLADTVNKGNFDNLFYSLLNGEADYFALQLQEILQAVVSIYDTANKESFYHGFMLGMTALFLGSNYEVLSNRESGYGRFDLAIFPKDTRKTGVIMEFKVISDASHLVAKAEEALRQIEKQKYATEFTQRNITDVWKYGIAFCGKKVAVVNNRDR